VPPDETDWWAFRGFGSRVLEKNRDTRYGVTAAYWEGMSAERAPREAEDLLAHCLASPHASRYLKGMARVGLLRCQLVRDGDEVRPRTRKLAEAIIADYPDTAITEQVHELLRRNSHTPGR
jgi:hypothetical protein